MSVSSITDTAASAAATFVASTPTNPLLELQPAYSRSLVVQLLVLSAVCALHIVLMLHLLFTTRYHLPLSRMNYFLLTGGCLISFIAIFWQMLECALGGRDRSQEWPYMFDYLQYSFPGDKWSSPKKVWWLLLNAIVVFLCHAAHIHVLTLLYPSKLETRLFMALLMPLALISCALSFSPLLSSQREQDIFDSGAAVCNSALTLLYTCALFFWGLYIARKRAWGQADASGSTTVFGGCALGMAILGTVLAFIGISRSAQSVGNDGWLDRVTWLVLLWQTWFTVWWWIGAGMYGAERPLDDEADDMVSSRSSRSKLRGNGSIRRFVNDNLGGLSKRKRRRAATGTGEADDGEASDAIELQSMTSENREAVRPPRRARAAPSNNATIDSESSSSQSTSTPPTFLQTLVRHIRKAHTSGVKAAHKEMLQTAENNPAMNDAIIGRRGKGWSVGGILQSRENNVLQNAAAAGQSSTRMNRATREERRLGATRLGGQEGGEGWEDLQEPPQSPSQRRRKSTVGGKKIKNWRRRDVTTYD